VANEENVYPFPDPNKTIINVTNEHSDAYKESFKEELLEENTEIYGEDTRCG
jgi:hypothetical protein